MAAPIDTTCPNCATVLRVPAELAGKKVKCKKCNTVIAIPAAAKPLPPELLKPGPAKAKPVTAKPAPPPPAADAPLKLAKDEDDDDDASPMGVIKESDAPRCPHCAKDMDPPDAMICLHCGYDLRERKRKESKAVVEQTFFDYFVHHIGAVLLLFLAIGLIVGSVICWINMDDWMTSMFSGTFLENDKDPVTNKTSFIVKPWCFSLWILIIVLWIDYYCAKWIFRRFFINYRPPEKLIAKKQD